MLHLIDIFEITPFSSPPVRRLTLSSHHNSDQRVLYLLFADDEGNGVAEGFGVTRISVIIFSA